MNTLNVPLVYHLELLGFTTHRKGIYLNWAKVNHSSYGEPGVSNLICRFFPTLAELHKPFRKLSSHDSLVQCLPLTLYLTSMRKFIGASLAQEVKGIEHPLYCLSRSLRGAKINHSQIERHCLAMMFMSQNLRHYLLVHCLNLITN